jgi:hypothetical protein
MDLAWKNNHNYYDVIKSYDGTWTARISRYCSDKKYSCSFSKRGFKCKTHAKKYLIETFYPPLNEKSAIEKWNYEAEILGITVSDLMLQIKIIDEIISD